ncbi:uncharacterized protein LY89DRAFT_155145 [Mollisia scopiformis]|uniref:2EXR domain-containing protein n=1 Tax=Mollisia scopiformis TaxID=149040 RepID=A0A194WZ43_MOLSC|nr:uncharacterized protein LY89DRAFT_155145 [Mollisia scopiformis]KUJ13226.1 hypothetical protein LY89DRAFT_155145 [Mollisia scopiformis]
MTDWLHCPGEDALDGEVEDEFRDELRLFQKQEWLKDIRESTRKHYEHQLLRVMHKHRIAQEEITDDFVRTQLQDIEEYGISAMRNRAVPAYTFDRFDDLPTELRLRIWSFASRMNKPRYNNVHAVDWFETFRNCGHDPRRCSSKMVYDADFYFSENRDVPSVLHICRESRSVAQQVYTLMPLDMLEGREKRAYFNTLYDFFFIGATNGETWTSFLILVDMVIKLNSSRPLRPQIQKDVEIFQNIRHLTVDFEVFATARARVWAEFPLLAHIVICSSPYANTCCL